MVFISHLEWRYEYIYRRAKRVTVLLSRIKSVCKIQPILLQDVYIFNSHAHIWTTKRVQKINSEIDSGQQDFRSVTVFLNFIIFLKEHTQPTLYTHTHTHTHTHLNHLHMPDSGSFLKPLYRTGIMSPTLRCVQIEH